MNQRKAKAISGEPVAMIGRPGAPIRKRASSSTFGNRTLHTSGAAVFARGAVRTDISRFS